jgi:hypothetical protein
MTNWNKYYVRRISITQNAFVFTERLVLSEGKREKTANMSQGQLAYNPLLSKGPGPNGLLMLLL